ncbi:MAG TPA: ATPase domain-containing protein [Bryobacteraceae bacterium]|nr:ATPase domain-containing protein [Bryobacteraceae bacterium]
MRNYPETTADGERTSTGIDGLDDVLSGGLPASHMFLVEGEPGSGKTTLGLQFLLEGAANGEKVLYITLSETEKEIRQVARSHGWKMDNLSIVEFTPKEDSLRPEDQYSAFHPAEIELQDTTQSILQEVARVQPQRVVFDSLSEIRLLSRDQLRYRRQILALKHFFSTRSCTVMLLDDLTGEADDQQLRTLAHGVLKMEMKPLEYGLTRRRLRVVKLRGSAFREGYHDYRIVTGGVRVFPRLVSAEHRDDFEARFVSCGMDGMDALWGGGLDRGTSTLILGPAGVGKSSLAMAYASAAVREGSAHVFLFDEGVGPAIRRATGLGLNAQALCDAGKLSVEQIDPAELSPGEFTHRVRQKVEDGSAKLVIIDSLNGLLAAMPGEDFLVLHMHELLSYLSRKGVTSILVLAQTGIMGSGMASPVDLSYLADNILMLRYFEAGGEVRKAVSVVKRRGGKHESTIRELDFRESRIRLGNPLSEFRGVLTGVPTYLGETDRLQEAPNGTFKR